MSILIGKHMPNKECIQKRRITITRNEVSDIHVVSSLDETHVLAQRFAKTLHGGEILALSGNLGAGKTTFVQSLARELGVRESVTSPTFVIMKIYTGDMFNLCHIDAYRLVSSAEFDAIGAGEYLGESRTITAIEWPEHVQDLLPADAIRISFEILFAS